MNSGGLSATRLDRLHDAMSEYVERRDVAGVVTLVCRHDTVSVDAIGARDLESGTPMERDTIFRIASMTKPITAVAAMILVEETTLRLDDPVDPWLPELADRQVLRSVESPLDDTVPAVRAITLRDLLTFRLGAGAVMASPGAAPIQQAMADGNITPGPVPPALDSDTWMRRLGALPLVHQPGEGWMYHTGSDALGVLIARASGMSLGEFLAERIFVPLGMADTAFSVPEAKLDRLATCYRHETGSGGLAVKDPARGGAWSHPPAFPSGGGGLVSTADDFLAFGRMLLGQGRTGSTRILSRPTVALMTRDHITPRQKAAFPFFPGFWDATGWGFGMSVVTRPETVGPSPGSYGWSGGFNTHWYNDPAEDLVGMILVQREATGAAPETIDRDFWTFAYGAIDD